MREANLSCRIMIMVIISDDIIITRIMIIINSNLNVIKCLYCC